ncbi:MAG: hypothetical protein RR454_04970 [Clostridia bacterium]
MVITFNELVQKNSAYVDVKGKIGRDVKSGLLIPIVKGLYETDKNTSGHLLSICIYGPSYLSFDYALAHYSLIPEAVYKTYTSATFNKRKKKRYDNAFGTFIFRDVPAEAFPYGVIVKEENGYAYQIATPEKALCDKLYTISPVNSIKGLKMLLFEDLRIDEDEFNKLNKADIKMLAPLYHSTNLNLLSKLLKGEKE